MKDCLVFCNLLNKEIKQKHFDLINYQPKISANTRYTGIEENPLWSTIKNSLDTYVLFYFAFCRQFQWNRHRTSCGYRGQYSNRGLPHYSRPVITLLSGSPGEYDHNVFYRMVRGEVKNLREL